MKKLLFIFIFSIGLLPEYFAQTAPENLEKYWNYRDRFKKYFVKIGSSAGESILAQQRCSQNQPNPFNLNCGCSAQFDIANLKWGDATVWTGYYLAVLSSEYALLKQNGQDTKNTLNEIYYVLNAINRLDKRAEVYLSKGSSSENLNGFFLRDDVPANFEINAGVNLQHKVD
jgi:hypothetical protein